jgi:hypothetical protein
MSRQEKSHHIRIANIPGLDEWSRFFSRLRSCHGHTEIPDSEEGGSGEGR